MNNALTLARPYARAAFQYAKAGNALADWNNKLSFAATAMAEPKIAALNGNPRVSPATLIALLLPEGDSQDSPCANFLWTMHSNQRLSLLPEVLALYEDLRREAERRLKVVVRSAVKLSEAQATELAAVLGKRFNREIEMENRLDSDVIGGAIIEAGDVVIDGSTRGHLQSLQTSLSH